MYAFDVIINLHDMKLNMWLLNDVDIMKLIDPTRDMHVRNDQTASLCLPPFLQ